MFDRRKLLEFAAKAAGKQPVYCEAWKCMAEYDEHEMFYDWKTCWNPITNNSDALTLMAKLKITLNFGGSNEFPAVIANYQRPQRASRGKHNRVIVKYVQEEMFSSSDANEVAEAKQLLDEVGVMGVEAATRLAIVMAAAEIGKMM